MQKRKSKFIFFVTFLLLGTILAAQFRTTLYKNQQKAAAAFNIENLISQINKEKETEAQLKNDMEESIKRRDELRKAFFEDTNDDSLWSEWESIRLIAGLTDVSGPGIEIKLDDAPAKAGGDPRLLIIHDSDIKKILNELKKAGAQAISINGERIVNTSEQVCAGPTILINKNRYPVPYVINVIGDPDLLYEAVSGSEALTLMIEDKIRVEIKKLKTIKVPKFNDEINKLDDLISELEVVRK